MPKASLIFVFESITAGIDSVWVEFVDIEKAATCLKSEKLSNSAPTANLGDFCSGGCCARGNTRDLNVYDEGRGRIACPTGGGVAQLHRQGGKCAGLLKPGIRNPYF